MTNKKQLYKELCELGKLGVDVKYPSSFRNLEFMDLSTEFQTMNSREVADYLISLSKNS